MAPSASGSFGVRPVTTSEITNMLNGFLGHKVGSPLRTTSHSMKDTLLAHRGECPYTARASPAAGKFNGMLL